MTELILKLFVKDYKNTASGKVRENYGAVSGMVGIIVNMILSLVFPARMAKLKNQQRLFLQKVYMF